MKHILYANEILSISHFVSKNIPLSMLKHEIISDESLLTNPEKKIKDKIETLNEIEHSILKASNLLGII